MNTESSSSSLSTQEATVYDCLTFDTVRAYFASEDIWCQEILVDHCRTSPCQNNATCLNEPYRYSCVCAPGFTDPECMTREWIVIIIIIIIITTTTTTIIIITITITIIIIIIIIITAIIYLFVITV